MAGTTAGGIKTAATNKKKYGADYYVKIGQKGGKLGRTGGFFADRELAARAGRKGGRISRRPRPEYIAHTSEPATTSLIGRLLGLFKKGA